MPKIIGIQPCGQASVIKSLRSPDKLSILDRVRRLYGERALLRLSQGQRERLEAALKIRVKLRGSPGRVSDAEIEEEWEAVLLGVPAANPSGAPVWDYFFPN